MKAVFLELLFLSVNYLLENRVRVAEQQKIFTTHLRSLLPKPVELIFQRELRHWDTAEMKNLPLTCRRLVNIYQSVYCIHL